jgi:hypothetical protein
MFNLSTPLNHIDTVFKTNPNTGTVDLYTEDSNLSSTITQVATKFLNKPSI